MFDCYQPYFFDDLDTEEDFYKSTAPSEDIWKKFELLPTPPMSPTRTVSGAALHLSPGDKLSWLSKVLGQDEDYEGHLMPDTQELFGNLSSIIIQDCMWSSFSASKQLEKINSKVSAAAHTGVSPVSPVAQISVRPNKTQCVSPGGPIAASPTDCVNPAAVLAFPASSSRKLASSGSESHSHSSDDEEEIDVVTVESKQSRLRLGNGRKPVTITVRADPCPNRFHMSVHRQQHNYAARSPDSEPEEDDDEEDDDDDDDDDESEDEPQSKRFCTSSTQHRSSSARGSQPVSPSETPLNSDAEDTDRRRNHNFLERKRRNDLRSRFLALRDQIPGLESSKTPKVAILTHATDYLVNLHATEKRQLQEKKRLRSRQQNLLRKLSELKRS